MSAEPVHDQGKQSTGTSTYVLLLLVAMGATAGGWLWRSQVGARVNAPSSSQAQSVVHLDTFVLNLSDRDDRAYLRVGIDLGLRRDSPTSKGEALPVALIRDTILSVLAKAHSEDVLTPEGKQKLKGELLRAVQERAPELGVGDVYFTEFLIQR